MMKRELVITTNGSEDHNALATIEAGAREEFNSVCFAAQAAWHNENEKLHRLFQDNIGENNSRYRDALVKAQRTYRDATADRYE